MFTATPLTTTPSWGASPSGRGRYRSDATTQRTAPRCGLGRASRGSRGTRKLISGDPGPAPSARILPFRGGSLGPGQLTWGPQRCCMSPNCLEPHAGTRHSDTRTHDPTSAEAARRPVSCKGCWARHRTRTQTPGGREARMPLQNTSLKLPVDLQLLQNRKGKN